MSFYANLKLLCVVSFHFFYINNGYANQPILSVRENETKDTIYILSENGVVEDVVIYTIPFDDLKNDSESNENDRFPSSDTIFGDFNGDYQIESCWMSFNSYNYEKCGLEFDSISCQGILQFSNQTIPKLIIPWCPYGLITNEGDLNNDGKDEIGVLPGWLTSACRFYHVFSLKDKDWIEICEPIANSENMREAGIDYIKNDKINKENLIIYESMLEYIDNNPKNKIPFKYVQGCGCSYGNVVIRYIKIENN